MDATDLRVFEAVARIGSMSKAARELNTVQSNITARIRALFERSSWGVTLTAAGRRRLPYAGHVARLLEDARRAALDKSEPSGPLAIASMGSTAALRLSPLLAGFAAAHPEVELPLRRGMSSELVDAVLDRAVARTTTIHATY